MELSTKMEVVSLLITTMLAWFHYDRQSRSNLRYQLFTLCLALSGTTIILDLLTSWIINEPVLVPGWLNMLLNMLYFIFQHATFSLMAGYSFYLMFEHASNRHCFYICITVISTFAVVMIAAILTNPHTHWFFYFEDGLYRRGPFNRIGYAVLLLELGMLGMCYLRNRAMVSRPLRRLMHSLLPLIVIFTIMQQLLPNILMAGTISALTNLMFFVSFQSNRIGQDALTGLPNRHTFFQDLETRRRKKHYFHLIILYLEHFELINRKFGMKNGDAILYMVGRYLEQYRPEYQAFRFGNTRFLLFGTFDSYPKTADALARKVQERFSEPWEAAGAACSLQVSMAHMIFDSTETNDSQIIDQLEYTLCRSREMPGNSLLFFDNHMKAQFERNLYVLNQIRHAIEEESFQLYLQPIYSLKDQAFTTAESLLRLQGEDGKLIPPGEFIPLAEKSGLIDEISWIVLKMLCRFWAEHPDLPLKCISMNMSIQQLTDRNFLQRIHSCLAQYNVAPEKLRIEITERTITENPLLVRTVMAQMAAEGVRFYLDDFGVGYSNLSGMMNLPFETVKLDSSLLKNIETDEKAMNVVRLLVQLLHNAGFLVVAEGLERSGQVEKAASANVDRIQGYFYAQPMEATEIVDFFSDTQQKRSRGPAERNSLKVIV